MTVARTAPLLPKRLAVAFCAVLVGTVALHPQVAGAAMLGTAGPPAAQVRSGSAPTSARCSIVGTSRADRLAGTRRADVICGRGGNDVIRGGDGNDRIAGGAGNDALAGGAGADEVDGGPGADKVNGGAGNDRLRGGPGADSLHSRDGGRFIDRLSCGGGPDVPFADPEDVVGRDCEGRAPVDVALSGASVREHQPAGTLVGVLSVSDPDVGDRHSFALVGGPGDAGNAAFVIDGALLKTAAPLDHESSPIYVVRVAATDRAGHRVVRVFSIAVADVDEAPVDVALSGASVREHQPAGTLVGVLSVSDPDVGDRHSFALVAGPGDAGNAAFVIDGALLKTAAPLDHESTRVTWFGSRRPTVPVIAS